jgi:hypothetical protein
MAIAWRQHPTKESEGCPGLFQALNCPLILTTDRNDRSAIDWRQFRGNDLQAAVLAYEVVKGGTLVWMNQEDGVVQGKLIACGLGGKVVVAHSRNLQIDVLEIFIDRCSTRRTANHQTKTDLTRRISTEAQIALSVDC